MPNTITRTIKNKMFNLKEQDCLLNLLMSQGNINFNNHKAVYMCANDILEGVILESRNEDALTSFKTLDEKIIFVEPSLVYISWEESQILHQDKNIKNEFVAGIQSISNVAKTMIEHYLRLQDNSQLNDEIKIKQKALEKSLKDLADVTVSSTDRVLPKLDKDN